MNASPQTTRRVFSTALFASAILPARGQTDSEPLPSWNPGPARQAILRFIQTTTDRASPQFVPPEQRIAAFDQDGTLWVEHPLYTQAAFAIARVHELAPHHPEWRTKVPFNLVLSNHQATLARLTESEWAEILFSTHAGMSQAEFQDIAARWLTSARDPRFHRLYTDLVYQPMIEVLHYLRANAYQTCIASGGGQDFIRAYSQATYGIPPSQVIGSSLVTKYEVNDGKPELMRLPKPFLDCNFGGKPVAIDLFIGQRPYASFGNSTGDRQMLEWTGAGSGARLNMLVLHDDPVREFAYGPANGLPNSSVGTFDQSLMDEADKRGWSVISMKRDWKRVFAFE